MTAEFKTLERVVIEDLTARVAALEKELYNTQAVLKGLLEHVGHIAKRTLVEERKC